MAYNASAIGTAKKLTLAPIVGHLEETKPFARASKAVYQPDAGPVDASNLAQQYSCTWRSVGGKFIIRAMR